MAYIDQLRALPKSKQKKVAMIVAGVGAGFAACISILSIFGVWPFAQQNKNVSPSRSPIEEAGIIDEIKNSFSQIKNTASDNVNELSAIKDAVLELRAGTSTASSISTSTPTSTPRQ